MFVEHTPLFGIITFNVYHSSKFIFLLFLTIFYIHVSLRWNLIITKTLQITNLYSFVLRQLIILISWNLVLSIQFGNQWVSKWKTTKQENVLASEWSSDSEFEYPWHRNSRDGHCDCLSFIESHNLLLEFIISIMTYENSRYTVRKMW